MRPPKSFARRCSLNWPQAARRSRILKALVDRATSSDAGVAAEASRDFFVELIEPLCDAFDREATAQYVQRVCAGRRADLSLVHAPIR